MRKFHRTRGDRKIFLRSLMGSFVIKERMVTTTTRAKEIRPRVEKLVTVAKKGDVASLRRLIAALPKKSAEKLFYDIAPRYKERKGGYTRIVKQGQVRKRDGVEKATIEFI